MSHFLQHSFLDRSSITTMWGYLIRKASKNIFSVCTKLNISPSVTLTTLLKIESQPLHTHTHTHYFLLLYICIAEGPKPVTIVTVLNSARKPSLLCNLIHSCGENKWTPTFPTSIYAHLNLTDSPDWFLIPNPANQCVTRTQFIFALLMDILFVSLKLD